jgi:MFS family permease
VQTGFGPFFAVFLVTHGWTGIEIGVALSVSTGTSVAMQLPAGVMVDAVRDKRWAAGIGLLAIGLSAAMIAAWPARLPVLAATVLHGVASCVLSPALAALALGLAARGGSDTGERLGRNARWASIGSAAAAVVLGAAGSWLGDRSVLIIAAALCVPALVALMRLPAGSVSATRADPGLRAIWSVLSDRRLLIFAGCMALFQLSNAATLPLAATELTKRAGALASMYIAACIIGPQMLVALASPAVGRWAGRFGRRPVLALGLTALPLRAVLLAWASAPWTVVVVQVLDGVSGAAVGVLLPLIVSDVTRGTARFNTALAAVGIAAGAGASLSTTLAGFASDMFGQDPAFLALAAIGVLAVAVAALAVPETRAGA